MTNIAIGFVVCLQVFFVATPIAMMAVMVKRLLSDTKPGSRTQVSTIIHDLLTRCVSLFLGGFHCGFYKGIGVLVFIFNSIAAFCTPHWAAWHSVLIDLRAFALRTFIHSYSFRGGWGRS
jgi:hypothetical protein